LRKSDFTKTVIKRVVDSEIPFRPTYSPTKNDQDVSSALIPINANLHRSLLISNSASNRGKRNRVVDKCRCNTELIVDLQNIFFVTAFIARGLVIQRLATSVTREENRSDLALVNVLLKHRQNHLGASHPAPLSFLLFNMRDVQVLTTCRR